MGTLPTNRTVVDSDPDHVNDHNELHSRHNTLLNFNGDLASLSDVDLTGSGDGLTLKYDAAAGRWKPATDETTVAATSITADTIDTTFGVFDAGSGMAFDPVDPRFFYAVADDPTEGPGGVYRVWCHEVDNVDNPTTATRRARYTVTDSWGGDTEGIFFVNIGGVWYLAVWANADDTVRIYTKPTPVSGQVDTVTSIGATQGTWTPVNGILGGNTESIRYNRWEDRIYAIRNRGSGVDDNDNDRELWYTVTGWSTAALGALPSTTMVKANTGAFVTRPQGSSPVPNAQGDMDFAAENIMVLAGVATNTVPNPDVINDYIMVFLKDVGQTWDQKFAGAGPFYPDKVLGQTTRVNEHITCNVDKFYLLCGPELGTSNETLVHYTIGTGGGTSTTLANPTRTDAILAPKADLSGWKEVASRGEHVGTHYTGDLSVLFSGGVDAGPALRAAQTALGGPGNVIVPAGKNIRLLIDTTVVYDGFTVGCRFGNAQGLIADGFSGSGRGHEGTTTWAPVVIFVDGTAAGSAVLLWDSTDGNPRWGGGGMMGVAVTDMSAGGATFDTAITVKAINDWTMKDCSVENFLKANQGYGVKIVVASNGQPTQYGHVVRNRIQDVRFGVWLEGNNPDWEILDNNIQRDSHTLDVGSVGVGGTTNKLDVVRNRIQFFDAGVDVDGTVGVSGDGKHVTIVKNHFEGDSGAAAGGYAYGVRIKSPVGAKSMPLLEGNDFGNSAKFASLITIDGALLARINDTRLRDSKWLTTADVDLLNGASATVDGTAV